MPITDKRKESMYEYARKNIKRIPLDVQKDHYERIKAHAEEQGETVNGFIKRAIDEIMYEEGQREMVETTTIERRFRYRLKLHGLTLHKEKGVNGATYYYITDEINDARPNDDDPDRWFSFSQLESYCAELAEKDAEYFAEQRRKRAEENK